MALSPELGRNVRTKTGDRTSWTSLFTVSANRFCYSHYILETSMPPPSVQIRLKEQIRNVCSGFVLIKIKSCFYCNYCNYHVAVLCLRLHEAECELCGKFICSPKVFCFSLRKCFIWGVFQGLEVGYLFIALLLRDFMKKMTLGIVWCCPTTIVGRCNIANNVVLKRWMNNPRCSALGSSLQSHISMCLWCKVCTKQHGGSGYI